MIPALILIALSTWHVVEVCHHAKILQSIQDWADGAADGSGPSAILGKLYKCPFCLSPWVSLLHTILWFANPYGMGHAWLLIMSGARLANLGNDYFYSYTRTHDADDDDTPSSQTETQAPPDG